jgi:hypothetical protein
LFLFAVDTLRSKTSGLTESSGRPGYYLATATLAVFAFDIAVGEFGRHLATLPIRGLGFRTGAAVVAGLIAGIPWLAIVWLGTAECNELKDVVLKLPEGGLLTDNAPAVADDYRAVIKQLLDLWKLLYKCALAFTVAVVAIIVSTGALRAAFLSTRPALAGQFPPANVLFYGAFYALVLLAITMPMAIAWRDRARQVVERTYPLPPDGQPTDAWVAARARLEHLLYLDLPVLRNPLTALNVFTPLITAALVAFIPQLGQ